MCIATVCNIAYHYKFSFKSVTICGHSVHFLPDNCWDGLGTNRDIRLCYENACGSTASISITAGQDCNETIAEDLHFVSHTVQF